MERLEMIMPLLLAWLILSDCAVIPSASVGNLHERLMKATISL